MIHSNAAIKSQERLITELERSIRSQQEQLRCAHAKLDDMRANEQEPSCSSSKNKPRKGRGRHISDELKKAFARRTPSPISR